MLPIVLVSETLSVGLAGAGDGHARRASLLAEAGITPVAVDVEGSLPAIRVLFVAGLETGRAEALARRAREQGILVNVEDVPELCDFHVPAIVRRGDLVLTASTGGRVPGLARRLREWLGSRFGDEWNGHVRDLSSLRADWRAEGIPSSEVARRTREVIYEKGWLQ